MPAFASKTYSKRSVSRAVAMVAAVATLAITACSPDSISAPTAAPVANNNLIGGLVGGVLNLLTPAKGLLRNTTLGSAVVVSQTVTSAGGTIAMPSTGLTVTVPAGAIVGAPLTITITALPGKTVAYEFEPHGTVFAKPLQFSQSLTGTNYNPLHASSLSGGYFKLLSQLNLLTGLSLLDETYPVSVSNGRVQFSIKHFSGYMVSTGRSDSGDDNLF